MKYLISFLALILLSCGTSGNQESDQESTSERVSQNKSCLADMPDPATWLPLSTAAALVKVPEAEIRQKIYQDISCGYSWKSDRTYTMKIGNREMEVEANNSISISTKNLDEEIEKWLAKSYVKQTEMSYVEYFDNFHGAPMTKEEKEEVNKSLDEKAERDENFDKKSAETAKGLLALSKTENFTELNDLGDKANYYIQLAPNLRELRLAILHGNVVLSITVDVSDDDAEDLSTARAVAEAVMANCN
jgi:hypothetical protein